MSTSSSSADTSRSEPRETIDPFGKVGVFLFILAFGLMASIVLGEVILSVLR